MKPEETTPEPVVERDQDIEKTKRAARLLYFALGIISIVLTLFLYWLISGNDALQIKGKVAAEPLVVETQKTITLKVSYCRTSWDEGRVIRRFVNETSEVLAPTVAGQLPRGCNSDFPIAIPIPDSVTPGKYHINYRITYQTNPLKTVVEEFDSEEFTVIPASTAATK